MINLVIDSTLYKTLKALNSLPDNSEWLNEDRSLLHAHTVAFCHTLKVLSRTTDEDSTISDRVPLLLLAILGEPNHFWPDREPNQTWMKPFLASMPPMKERIRAMTVICLFRAKLRRNGLREARDTGRKTETVADRVLPTTQNIPFQKLLMLPLPVSPDTAFQLLNCHVLKMATASFFEDGEWLGTYFTHNNEAISVIRVKFSATTSAESPDVLKLRATGRDHMGRILICGLFNRSSCQFSATVVQVGQSQPSVWDFSLLPCGLAGLRLHSQGSWLWMYKADWVGS